MFKLGNQTKVRLFILLCIFLLTGLFAIIYKYKLLFKADEINTGTTGVANLTNNGADYEGSLIDNPRIPKYEKFELTFDINRLDAPNGAVMGSLSSEIDAGTVNPYWPYDPNPAANTQPNIDSRGDGKMPIEPGKGISVDGLFTNDNWATTITQPGFWYQDFSYDPSDPNRTISSGRSWLSPQGKPVWKIRFAPTGEGIWKYKIRITEASGTTQSGESELAAVASSNHGFAKVSPTDSRYFETSDGTYLPMLGLSNDAGSTAVLQDEYPKLKSMGINLVRSWWQASNPGLALFGTSGQGGDQTVSNLELTTDNAPSGRLVVAKLNNNGSTWTTVPVQPTKTYRFSAKVKTVGLAGNNPAITLNTWGNEPTNTPNSKDFPTSGDTDWHEISSDVTIGSGAHELTWMGISKTNTTSGEVYVSDWSFKEILDGGVLGGEILLRPSLNANMEYPQSTAFAIDNQLEMAKQNNIYIKAVIEEKSDGFFSRIQADGLFGTASDDNVYASPTHASRTYQSYYWHYLIARYGYSTALHSIEFANEADPHNGNHYGAIDALAQYFKTNDPNRHMASTSNWHSFPREMWSQPGIDYADLHMYLGMGIAIGGNRIVSGWDGTWGGATNGGLLDPNTASWDGDIKHSGTRSLKIKVPGVPNVPPPDGTPISNIGPSFDIGVRNGHNIKVSYWAKAQNYIEYTTWPNRFVDNSGLYPNIFISGGDYYMGRIVPVPSVLNDGEWHQVESTFAITKDSSVTLIFENRSTNSDQDGYIWFDDVKIEDLTTNEVLNYNGGFDNTEPENYDVVAGHESYSHLAYTQGFNKPTIRGEVGFAYSKRYTDPYKGFAYTGEDQDLINDTAGIWWKKWTWANVDPGGLIEIYWWKSLLLNPGYGGLYPKYGKAYQNFISDIKLSNGKYKDINATTSDSKLRVLGQKQITNGKADKAHLWIDNAPYTWKNVVDAAAGNTALASPISGTVTIPGMKENETFDLQWWNTSESDPAKQIINTTKAVSDASGNLNIPITDLISDVALKISISSVAALDKPVTNSLSHPITYKNSYKVTGTKTASVTTVLVNNTEATLNNDTYEAIIDLGLGNNTITVVGKNSSGNQSESVVIQLNRRKGGDANGDNSVNINDFGSLMANWGTGKSYLADFNEDNKVDMNDFSMMMSAWGK